MRGDYGMVAGITAVDHIPGVDQRIVRPSLLW